jgi:hypothetical protein
MEEMSLMPSARRSSRIQGSRKLASRVPSPRHRPERAAATSAAHTVRSTRLWADQPRIARSPARPLNRHGRSWDTPRSGTFRSVVRFVQRSLPAPSEAIGCAIGIPHRSPHRSNLLNQVLVCQPLTGRTFDHAFQPVHRRSGHVPFVQAERELVNVGELYT